MGELIVYQSLQCPYVVCLSHYLLLNHWTGPWGGAKRSHIIKFQLQSQFQRFLNQTLCVFSQMKDIKHIRQDFHLVAWVIPGVGLEGTGVGGGGGSFFLKCELLT